YPIGSRNIVGDTTGTEVPSGYVGETTTPTTWSAFAISGAATVNIATHTLPSAGCWMVYVLASVAGAAEGRRLFFSPSLTSVTRDSSWESQNATPALGNEISALTVRPINVNAPTPIYVVGYPPDGDVTTNGRVFAVR